MPNRSAPRAGTADLEMGSRSAAPTPAARSLAGSVLAVVGGGNGANALAADLASRGADVGMLDQPAFAEAMAATRSAGAIVMHEKDRRVRVPLAWAGHDPRAIAGADVVLVVVPAFAHRSFADLTVPHLREGAIVVVLTGGLGCLEWAAAARRIGRTLDFDLADTSTLPFAARLCGPGEVRVLHRVRELSAAAFPGRRAHAVAEALAPVLPGAKFAGDLLEPALRNVNGVIHPPVMLMNVQQMEAATGRTWYMWRTGVTPSVARLVDHLDGERLRLGEACGLRLPSAADEQWLMGYGRRGSIAESIASSEQLLELAGPSDVGHRFFTEDVPFFLAPWIELGRIAAVDTPTMTSVAHLASLVAGLPGSHGRRLADLGVPTTRLEDVQGYLREGARAW